MRPIVLLLASSAEFNLHVVKNALLHLGADPIYVDCSFGNVNFELTIQTPDEGAVSYIECNDRRVGLSDVTGVWTRGISFAGVNPPRPGTDENLFIAELAHSCGLLWQRLGSARWLNPIVSIRLINRLVQLEVALKNNLDVPPSIVSSSGKEILKFANHHGDCIAKRVSQGGGPEEGPAQILTNMLPIDQKLSEYLPSPVLVQKAISKFYELRVVVVGSHVFAAAIHSSTDSRTSVDSRAWTRTDLTYFRARLSDEEADKLVRLNRDLGYNYSSMDLIRTPDGKLVFLEANPSGQWTFLEAHTGYPITETMAKFLCGR